MRRWIYWLLLNIAALWIAVVVVPGVQSSGMRDVLWAGVILAVVNGGVAPILRFLTFPLRALTLGLFSVVVNIFLFYLVAWVSQRVGISFQIQGLLAAVEGALVVSLILFLGRQFQK